MKCPQCGQQLPADSIFCQFCGHRLEQQPAPSAQLVAEQQTLPTAPPPPGPDDLPFAPPALPKPPKRGSLPKSGYTGYTDAPEDAAAPPKEESGLSAAAAPKKALPFGKFLPVLLAVVIVAAVVFALRPAQTVPAATPAPQMPAVEELNFTNAQKALWKRTEIFISGRDAGRASDDFYANKAILRIKKGESAPLYVTLKEDEKAATVYWVLSNDGAEVTAGNWNKDTLELKVTGKKAGDCYITFNDEDHSRTFRVMVIVKE